MGKRIGALLLTLLSPYVGKTDYWNLPTCKKYYAADSTAAVYVVPTCISISKQRRNPVYDTCSGTCRERKPCMATVFKKYAGKENACYSFEMVNPYVPHKAFISKDGVYVISLDDWGGVGTGKNVLVIYKNGVLLRRYTLTEISPFPIYNYSRTSSSIWWFESLCFGTNNTFEISFKNKAGEKAQRFFNAEKPE